MQDLFSSSSFKPRSTFQQLKNKVRIRELNILETEQMDIISFSYAAALAFGGLMGYLKAGSTQSLYSGLFLGGVMSYGAYQTSHDSQNVVLSLIVSCGTLGLMGQRYMETGKVMPAGVVAILSALMAARFALRLCNIKTP